MTTDAHAPSPTARDRGPTPPPVATSRRQLDAASRPFAARLLAMTRSSLLLKVGLGSAVLRRDELAGIFTAGRRDPYPLYERARRRGRLNPSVLDFHYTADHALTATVLGSRSWGAVPPESGVPKLENDLNLSLLELNPPDHTRLRRIVAPMFARGRMPRYEDRITATLEDLLDAAPTDAPWDLVSVLAAPLPTAVISDLLGIPTYDEDTFLRFGRATAGALDGIRSPAHAYQLLRAQRHLERVFLDLFEERARHPGEDAVSAVVAARDEGRIAPQDMVALCSLLLLAGFETTVNLIGSAVALLLHRPEQWRMIVEEPELAHAAVEETLRYSAPVQLTGRYAQQETDLAGHTFGPGEGLILLLAGANRDPEVFTRPNVFDITRTDTGEHLAFSAGAHYCIGAPLARLEATLALQALARRFPDLHLAGPVVPRRSITVRGPERLPVRSSRRG